MTRQLVKIARLWLKLTWLRLTIVWHSLVARAVLAGWFNFMGSRWHIRKAARMIGLRQQPGEAWEDFQRRTFEAHRINTGIDIEAVAQRIMKRSKR